MQWIKLIIFIFAVITTLDFIVDTIEIMSGRSKQHNILGEKDTDHVYQAVPIILWTGFYILSEIPW